MLETPHVAVGAAIATKIGNPALALPLALASHFVLDKIPHWNPHTYTETETNGKPENKSTILAAGDVVIALTLGLFIASRALPHTNQAILIIIASFVSVLPDLVKFPFYYLNRRKGLLRKWVDFERSLQVETSLIPGIFTQLAIVFASLWWIL